MNTGEAFSEIGRDGIVWRWSLLVFISGFLIVALQIVWYRLIGVLLQSNGYSFSLVLAVFLLGDAAGLLVGARTIDRISDPRRFFFLMQGVATALALAGAWFVYLAIGTGLLPSTFVDRDIMSGRADDIALIVPRKQSITPAPSNQGGNVAAQPKSSAEAIRLAALARGIHITG